MKCKNLYKSSIQEEYKKNKKTRITKSVISEATLFEGEAEKRGGKEIPKKMGKTISFLMVSKHYPPPSNNVTTCDFETTKMVLLFNF